MLTTTIQRQNEDHIADHLPSISVQKAPVSRQSQFNYDDFVFGIQPTDHIFLCAYKDGTWCDARIVPYQDLQLSPFALCFHYGQTIFEGMKAFRHINGRVSVFRPDKHYQRLARSLERMCMPVMEESFFTDAVAMLVSVDKHWIPDRGDISMYIRPFVIATEARLGVKVSEEYLFGILCSPMAQYYSKPLRVKVETKYVRAVSGGVGFAKCGGNYGAAMYPTRQANAEGYDQVLWTDARDHEFLEESGTMNIMVALEGRIITPPLSDTILDGVTRDSLIQIARDLNIPVEERRISYRDLLDAFWKGKKVEVFGVGTAAVLSPIQVIQIEGNDYAAYTGEDALMFRLKKELENIRTGRSTDKFNWNYFVE
jgi:branched-chain amino acid aminotransferase